MDGISLDMKLYLILFEFMLDEDASNKRCASVKRVFLFPVNTILSWFVGLYVCMFYGGKDSCRSDHEVGPLQTLRKP
jgi:hypothetical protein